MSDSVAKQLYQSFPQGKFDQRKWLNTMAYSFEGKLFPTDGFSEFSKSNGNVVNSKLMTIIAGLRNYHFSKFSYTGHEIFGGKRGKKKIKRLEHLLFLWGKAVVFKHNDEWVIANYTITKWNLDHEAVIVKPTASKKVIFKPLVVDEECVLFNHDQSFIFGKAFFGPLWRIWDFIKEYLTFDKLITNNAIVNKTYILIDPETSPEQKAKIKSATQESTDSVMEMGKQVINIGSSRSANNVINMDDRTDNLWKNLQNKWDQLLTFMGIESNTSSMKKERQINAELEQNNKFANGILAIEINERKDSVEIFNEVFKANLQVELSEVAEIEKAEQEVLESKPEKPKEAKNG